MFTGFKVTETLAHLNGILFTQDTLPKKHSSICLLMKFFSCPILADRVHTYFEIIHKYPGDNCPGYNGHWVGPSWVIVIIVTRHNCPLSSAAHLHIPPPLWHILDISSASKITRYKDPELDKQVSVTLSAILSPNYHWPASQAQCLRGQIRWYPAIRHQTMQWHRPWEPRVQTSPEQWERRWREFLEGTDWSNDFIIFVIFGHKERWDGF